MLLDRTGRGVVLWKIIFLGREVGGGVLCVYECVGRGVQRFNVGIGSLGEGCL